MVTSAVAEKPEHPRLFEYGPVPPPVGSNVSHTDAPRKTWEELVSEGICIDDWETFRDSGISPLNISELSNSEEGRREFLTGALMLGLGRKRMPHLAPQMLLVADALNANPTHLGVLLARRSSKTTSLLAVALGRVASRPGYLACYVMATTATKARQRFLSDIVAPLEELWPDEKTRPFKINRAGGSESIVWMHEGGRSRFQVLAPKGDAFRSDAWDLIILDEGGEASPEMSEDLTTGALSTMDTRDDATLVVAGTAALYRDGNLLWDMLEDGREKRNLTGIVEFAAPPTTSVRDIETWEQARALVLRAHPGIGFLTRLEIIEIRYNKLTHAAFLIEYLSIFAKLGGSSFIDAEHWAGMGQDGKLPTPPAHFRMAFAVHPNQTSACIVAAWRVKGKAHLLVLEHRNGVNWLAPKQVALARKYKLPVVTDVGNSVNVTELDRMKRAKPPVRSDPQNWNAVSAAAAELLKLIDAGDVVHYNQDMLDEAVRVAVKRGTKESKKWGFGRGSDEENDITPLEAGALALRAYDESKPRQKQEIITGS
jgi:hypothetical protein